ncbi:MAG: hypothetical protein PW734_00805 [Verrucomicrobium sp.]|nr:hypothetical protein [Verrucomicrobium sp.]
MIRAYRLHTGPDGHSHVSRGSVRLHHAAAVETIHVEESPPHSSLDWHPAPTTQYVITLAGTLEFVTRTGEAFTLRAGEILIAEDTAGSGHAWKLVDDQPWRRAYVTFRKGTDTGFQAGS